jgi:hypothetical protein
MPSVKSVIVMDGIDIFDARLQRIVLNKKGASQTRAETNINTAESPEFRASSACSLVRKCEESSHVSY